MARREPGLDVAMRPLLHNRCPAQRPSYRGLRVMLAGAVLAAVCAAAPTAFGQSADLQNLVNKIDRLQRELLDLQRTVYKGEPPPPSAGQGGGDLAPTQAARIDLRLSQFESALQSLTGQIEDVGFAIDRINARLDRLESDMDARLRQTGQQGLAASPGLVGQGATGLATAGQQPSSQPAQVAPPGDAQPGVIGSIRQSDLEAFQSAQPQGVAPAQGATQAATLPPQGYQLPGATARDKYNHAFSLLRQANYGEAELALRAFLAEHADDPLAGNAKYWLGETYYVRGDYQQAAITFAEAYQAYPDNVKAPDNLLKLAMALGSMGETNDSCGTLAELLRRYPNASAAVVQKARQQRQRLACP